MVTASFQLNVLTPRSLRTRTMTVISLKKRAGELPANTHHRHLQDGGGITVFFVYETSP